MKATFRLTALLCITTTVALAGTAPGPDPKPAGGDVGTNVGFVRRSEIYYQAPQDNQTHLARVLQVDVFMPGSPIQNTSDPNWNDHPQNAGGGQVEWLPYKTVDGSAWEAKVRCNFRASLNAAFCWFEHRRTASHNDDHDDYNMLFQDSNGVVWQACLLPVTQLPGTPLFRVRQFKPGVDCTPDWAKASPPSGFPLGPRNPVH
jgi:hypothetical protein